MCKWSSVSFLLFSHLPENHSKMETNPQQEEEKVVIPPYRSSECHNKSFQVMNTLREQNQLCDVLLKAGGNEIPAHRVVLASSSPYFLAMFTGELSESRQTVVTMREIDSHALELLVQYVYTAEIEVTEDNVQVRNLPNCTCSCLFLCFVSCFSQAVFTLGLITSRCSGKWACVPPLKLNSSRRGPSGMVVEMEPVFTLTYTIKINFQEGWPAVMYHNY